MHGNNAAFYFTKELLPLLAGVMVFKNIDAR